MINYNKESGTLTFDLNGCEVVIEERQIMIRDGLDIAGSNSDNDDWIAFSDTILSEGIHEIIGQYPSPKDLIRAVRNGVFGVIM